MKRPSRPLLLALAGVSASCGAPDGTRDLALHDTARVERAQRPDTPGTDELWRFSPGDVVERYETPEGSFVIHFTREGVHAVPARDDDENGVPDHVERVGAIYEEALAFYRDELGFRAPLGDEDVPGGNGGDGRYDVYLLDFNFSADGAFRREACLNAQPSICTGYLVQENDFAGYNYPSVEYANLLLASHELFHFVQAAYDDDQGSIMSEGSAVWASEKFAPILGDLEGFSSGYLSKPDRSLNVPEPGPVARFAYGAGVFFQFLEERYDRDIIRELWEGTVDGSFGIASPDWFLHVLDEVVAGYGSTFEEMYTDFVRWNLYTGSRADPSVSYAEGNRYAEVAMESVTAPFVDARIRVYHASARYYRAAPAGRAEMTAALVGEEKDLENLRLLLGTLATNGRVTSLVEVDVSDTEAKLPTAGAGQLVVIVVNTAKGGDSRRPALCIGSPDEVASCREELAGEPPLLDGGPTDGGDSEEPVEGCTCAGASLAPSWLALFAVSAFARRRTRRRPR